MSETPSLGPLHAASCGEQTSILCANVYPLDNPYRIDRAYAYYIPHGMEGVRPGVMVTVPFGRGNRKQIALVAEVYAYDPSEVADASLSSGEEGSRQTAEKKTPLSRMKPVDRLCAEKLFLTEEQLSLCFFLKEHTLCTVGEAVRTVIPSGAIDRLIEYYHPTSVQVSTMAALRQADWFVYEYIRTAGSVSAQSVQTHFGATAQTSLTRLLEKNLIRRDWTVKSHRETPTRFRYRMACSYEDGVALSEGKSSPLGRLTSPIQRRMMAVLAEADHMMYFEELAEKSGGGKAQVKALVQKGFVMEEPENLWRDPTGTPETPLHIELNREQGEAVATLTDLSDCGRARAALLYGVTGSGKTCVMLKMVDHMLDTGRGCIILLPEISLTPQVLSLFSSRYGRKVAVLHSGLSVGERYDSYQRIRTGDAPIVVGTRSAVFAPVPRLGMIVIDEEQEHTYKSDKNPKYHARDVARFRCAAHDALLLLASATPSMESFYKAEEGVYTLVRLRERYGGARLPDVRVVDMRTEVQRGVTSPMGQTLCQALSDVYSSGRQSVLFLNRRGYSTQVVCRTCGAAVTCPRCSVAMHYHTRRGSYSEGFLMCHWCGMRQQHPKSCPSCSSTHLVRFGHGTQRVEQDVQTLLPDARILRMDADTTGSKSSYEDLLGQFRRHEADVLLGTQMVTKGHDFPDVTLVGVLMADASLHVDDYRAAERTFAMLTQVIGRAGRAKDAGCAWIQTMNPDHEVIRLACRQDYDAFYRREISLRKALAFPPFCDMVLLTLTSPNEKDLQRGALRLSEEIGQLSGGAFKDVPLLAFGPFEAPVYRVDNAYRMRMVVKCRLTKRTRSLFSALLIRFGSLRNSQSPTLSVDFNPATL